MQEITYQETHYDLDCEIYNGVETCEPVYHIHTDLRCTIPQADGSTCKCCFEDGCYLNCPGTNTGGGGGGEDPPPDTGGGPTVPPAVPGTITAVAREVTSDQTCTAVSNSTTGIAGTRFEFAVGSQNRPPAQIQSGNTPVTFASQPVGSYTLVHTLPSSEYALSTPCIYRNGVLTAYGDNAYLPSGGTLEWRLGFTRGTAWAQTQGGDVYVSGTLRSYVPTLASPRVFSLDNDQGYPGLVTYGTSFDFDNNWALTGAGYVSTENWLTNSTRTTTDYTKFNKIRISLRNSWLK
jgi:hypothetical protein